MAIGSLSPCLVDGGYSTSRHDNGVGVLDDRELFGRGCNGLETGDCGEDSYQWRRVSLLEDVSASVVTQERCERSSEQIV